MSAGDVVVGTVIGTVASLGIFGVTLNAGLIGGPHPGAAPRPATIVQSDPKVICLNPDTEAPIKTILVTNDGQRYSSGWYLGVPGDQIALRPTQVGLKKWHMALPETAAQMADPAFAYLQSVEDFKVTVASNVSEIEGDS